MSRFPPPNILSLPPLGLFFLIVFFYPGKSCAFLAFPHLGVAESSRHLTYEESAAVIFFCGSNRRRPGFFLLCPEACSCLNNPRISQPHADLVRGFLFFFLFFKTFHLRAHLFLPPRFLSLPSSPCPPLISPFSLFVFSPL